MSTAGGNRCSRSAVYLQFSTVFPFQHVKPECLPKYWGGSLVDASGDGMCRDRLNIPTDPIPHDLYWVPSKETPDKEDITCTVIPAGKAKIFTYAVLAEDKPHYMVINRYWPIWRFWEANGFRYCDRTFGMGLWHSENLGAVNWALSEMDEWFPDFDYPGMPTTDNLKVIIPGPGVFKLKLGNESAWIRSLTVYHRVRFFDAEGREVSHRLTE